MAARKPARKAAKPKATRPAKSAKPANRPAKAPVRKAPAKPRKAAARPHKPAAGKAVPAPEPEPAAIIPPAVAAGWEFLPDTAATLAAPPRLVQARPFDPATGAWIAAPSQPQPQQQAPAQVDPAAPKGSGSPVYVLSWILLGLDLALLAFLVLGGILVGLVLILSPHSAQADDIRSRLTDQSQGSVLADTLGNLLLFGVIPFLWVLGTRVKPWEGAKTYLHLHDPGRAVLRGLALAAAMLLALVVVASIYLVVTQGLSGVGSLGDNQSKDDNPAVQGIVDNLTWPLAVLVAAGAGIGEEIFFRGLLQKRLGVWGQAACFGIAHATGGSLLQVGFALLLGVAFGFLVKRGWSLWSLMLAHALYDFTLLAYSLALR